MVQYLIFCKMAKYKFNGYGAVIGYKMHWKAERNAHMQRENKKRQAQFSFPKKKKKGEENTEGETGGNAQQLSSPWAQQYFLPRPLPHPYNPLHKGNSDYFALWFCFLKPKTLTPTSPNKILGHFWHMRKIWTQIKMKKTERCGWMLSVKYNFRDKYYPLKNL